MKQSRETVPQKTATRYLQTTIPEDAFLRLKLAAAKRRTTMGQIIVDLIDEHFASTDEVDSAA